MGTSNVRRVPSSCRTLRCVLVGLALGVGFGAVAACGGAAPQPASTRPSKAPARPAAASRSAPRPASTARRKSPAAEPQAGKPAYRIDNSETTEFKSSHTGKVYQLIVGLPPSYQKDPRRKYPVWYQLDGQWDFALLSAISGGLRYDEVVPELIVVGLSYGGKNPDYQALRDHDYPPTASRTDSGKRAGGGGARFLQALETEILPLIESSYRVDPEQRVLSGASFGGLFALYALFEKPELFSAVVALSPAAGWDNRWLFRKHQEFRESHSQLDKRVWLSVGSDEWPEYFKHNKDFFRELRVAAYGGLKLETHIIEGEKHAGNKPEAYNRAMRFVFASDAK
jgi:predicted alpha/beta superfamily hydrolase